MSHFAYTRSTWTAGTVLYAAEMAELDTKTFKSINGDDGGTWAPSSVITIGGAGATINLVGNNTVSSGYVEFDSSSSLNLDAGAQAFFQGDVLTYGAVYALTGTWAWSIGTNSSFDYGSNLSLNGTTTVGGQATFNGHTLINGTLDLTGAISLGSGASIALYTGTDVDFNSGSSIRFNSGSSTSFKGTLSFDSTASVSVKAPLICSEKGRVVKRYSIINSTGSDINGYGPVNSDVVVVKALTSDVTLNINETGLNFGDEITFMNFSGSFRLIISSPSMGSILALKTSSGFNNKLTLFWDGSVWHILGNSNNLAI